MLRARGPHKDSLSVFSLGLGRKKQPRASLQLLQITGSSDETLAPNGKNVECPTQVVSHCGRATSALRTGPGHSALSGEVLLLSTGTTVPSLPCPPEHGSALP